MDSASLVPEIEKNFGGLGLGFTLSTSQWKGVFAF